MWAPSPSPAQTLCTLPPASWAAVQVHTPVPGFPPQALLSEGAKDITYVKI